MTTKNEGFAPASLCTPLTGSFTFQGGLTKVAYEPYLEVDGSLLDSQPLSKVGIYINQSLTEERSKRPYSHECTNIQSMGIPCTCVIDTEVSDPRLRYTGFRTSTGFCLTEWEWELNRFPRKIRFIPSTHDVTNYAFDITSGRFVEAVNATLAGEIKEDPLATLINQIWEMKDLPQTLRSAPDFMAFLSKSYKGKSVRMKDAASQYLAYTYGIAPTVAQVDYFINDLKNEVTGYKNRLTALAEAAIPKDLKGTGAVTVKRVTAPADADKLRRGKTSGFATPEPVRSVDSSPIIVSRIFNMRTLSYADEREHLSIQYARELQKRARLHIWCLPGSSCVYSTFRRNDARRAAKDVVKQVVDVAWNGLQPLSQAWAMVPLSFVANWFVPIDKYIRIIERMFSRMNSNTYPIDGAWASYKVGFACSSSTWDSIELEPSFEVLTYEYDQDAGGNVPALCKFQYRLTPGSTRHTAWANTWGKYYRRWQVVDGKNFLFPPLETSLNVSKLTSLLALIASFKK